MLLEVSKNFTYKTFILLPFIFKTKRKTNQYLFASVNFSEEFSEKRQIHINNTLSKIYRGFFL